MSARAVDSIIFYPVAFAGLWTADSVVQVVLINWGVKVLVEVLFTPLTYLVVNAPEAGGDRVDFYDTDTNFTPFSLKD